MIERKTSKIVCSCGEKMIQVVNDGELLALDCTCGLRLNTEKETERMRQRQLEATDGTVGEEARKARDERMNNRLKFNDEFDPYKNKTHKAEWTSPGDKRRKKATSFLINLLVVTTGVCIVVLTWHLIRGL